VGLTIGCVLAVGLVLLLILGLVKSDDDLSRGIDRRIADNEAVIAPDFTLAVLVPGGNVTGDGGRLSLASLRGRPVVLNLWASWCDPCKEEAPILESLWTRYRAKGVVVLGVNTQDITGDAKAFIKRYGLTFPSVRDGSDDTQHKFGTAQLPETFVIDPDGRMRLLPFRGGITEASGREIAAHLDQVLGL
jgi:cytochrome c biogenesis protein CcmG/thiol:disulfide interchange protein DsbE